MSQIGSDFGIRFSHQISLNRYNKRDVDFFSLREYNDYLEQVEDIGKATELEASDSHCTKENTIKSLNRGCLSQRHLYFCLVPEESLFRKTIVISETKRLALKPFRVKCL